MTTANYSPSDTVQDRLPLFRPYRSLSYPGQPQRVFFGVAAGIAIHLRVSVILVRILFVIGLFILPFTIAYPLLVVAIPSGNPWSEAAIKTRQQKGVLARSLNETKLAWNQEHSRESETYTRRIILIVAGVLMFAAILITATYTMGVHINLKALQIILGLAGLVLTWSQNDRLLKAPAQATAVISAGLVMIAFSVISLILAGWPVDTPMRYLVTGIAVVIAVIVAVLPVLLQTNKQLSHVEVQRAQESQRADIAAHLHDSVLQTLALIRQQSHNPEVVASLARRQERELRNWLYGDQGGKESRFVETVKQTLADIEDKNNCAIEFVSVGDCENNEKTYAVAAALGEAAYNAVKHAQGPYSVYVEVAGNNIEAFVRDHGPGFDLESIPKDRHGVRDSIIRRLERIGGQAQVKSTETGTEVKLKITQEES